MGIMDFLGFIGIAVYIGISLVMARRIENFRTTNNDKAYNKAITALIKVSGMFLILVVLWTILTGFTMKFTPFQGLFCNIVVTHRNNTEYELLPITGEDTYILSNSNKVLFLLNGNVTEADNFEVFYGANTPYVEKTIIREKYYLKNSNGNKILLTSDWGSRKEYYTIHLEDESNIQKLNTY